MKKTVLVNGIIAGVIVSVLMFCSTMYYKKVGNFDYGMLFGYASMLLAFVFIFVGIKTYRDRYAAGVISFGKAFRIGLLIALIGSSFYVATWMVEYHYFFPDFFEKYMDAMVTKARASGTSEAEIAKELAKMKSMGEWYKNPVFHALFTYLEILPVGILVTIISGLILKRKPQA